MAFLGPLADLRPLPQPPDGEVDPGPVLRHGQPLRAGPAQGRRRARRRGGLRRRRGRDRATRGRASSWPPSRSTPRPSPIEARGDRREAFADWLASPENPYFARAIVNRVWRNFFGRGLIDPEDDLRATNPASDEPLMDWLVDDFLAHGYDVKHLIRTIMNSAAYARSSVPVPGNAADAKFLSHYPVKRLPAEVLLDAMARVTERADLVRGLSGGLAEPATARLEGREHLPLLLRPPRAGEHLLVRALGRAVGLAGPPPGQRRDPEREAPRRRRRRGQGRSPRRRATTRSSTASSASP